MDFMIRSFDDERTAALFRGEVVRSVHPDLRKRAVRKLAMIDKAVSIDDLRLPPSNHLEKKQGDLKGRWSIRVNDQWRILFHWTNAGAENVFYTDYH